MIWLIEKRVFDTMEAARAAGSIPSPEQQAEYEKIHVAAQDDGLPRIMSIVGNRAAIGVRGVLTDTPDLFAKWFGGGNTTYSEIRSALALAEANNAISEIILDVDSPGGTASAEWQETMIAVKNATKPVKAVVGNMAASAAYGIVSQAGSIEVQNELSSVGSIGVVQRNFISSYVVNTTSSNAPKKRPDPNTEEGRRAIREEIDQIEAVFIGNVAEGRGTNVDDVKENFGQGGMVFAAEAKRRGMIDSIAVGEVLSGESQAKVKASTVKHKTETAATSGTKRESKKMDLATLQAEHPAVYQSAVEIGANKERDRVTAHLTFGNANDCMDIATKAIEDGEEVTQTLMAKYMTAGHNKRDIEARTEDDTTTSSAADKTDKKDDEKTVSDEVCSLVEKAVGVTAEDKGKDNE